MSNDSNDWIHGFQFRPYQPGDETAINDGFNEIFHTSRPLDEWRWKFQPQENEASILVVLDKHNELVCHCGGYQQWLQVDGTIYPAIQLVDVYRLQRPTTKGKSIVPHASREYFAAFCGQDKMPLAFGFPGKRTLEIGRDQLGFSEGIQMHLWHRPVPPRWQFWHTAQPCESAIVAPPTEATRPLIDGLWERAQGRYAVIQVRNYQWLMRRYVTHPHHDYHYICVYDARDDEHSQVCAWAVLRNLDGILHWLDLLWDGQDSSKLVELDSAVMQLARRMGCKRVELWLTADEQAIQVIKQQGWQWQPHPLDLFLYARSWLPQLDCDDILRRMYYTMGDTDLY